MPAYNAENYILEAINSILEQSYENWELIIVNDGSTDDTVAQLKKITDKRIRIYHQNNKGQCAAANKAFSHANGDLIKFMDSDDLISKNFIEDQVKVISDDEKAIASASWGRFYNNNLNTFKLVTDRIDVNMKPIEWLVQSMTNTQVMLQCALWLIPRDILNRSGLWNEELSLINDFEFFIRVLLHADEIRYAENSVLYYRSGLGNSLSALKTRKAIESAFQSITLGTEHLLKFENSERIKKISANYFQMFIYDIYPNNADLIKESEQKIYKLSTPDVPFPAGGYTFFVSKLIGWKATKRLKTCISKLYPNRTTLR
jgi:glycosyltransferase involved in cell wall biosynthesis